jgi:multidrug efflux system membrane fusion protein
MQPIAVVFTLPQRDLTVVTAALARGPVRVEAMEQEGRGVLSRGTLQTIDNQIDVSTGTIKLKATFPNADLQLWPGQFISTRVVVDNLVDANVVPTPAVRRGPSGTFVYLVGPDQTVEVRPVKVVMQDEVRAVIGEGVEAGQRVVTVGFAQLANGKSVTIQDSADAAPSAGGPAANPAANPATSPPTGPDGKGDAANGRRKRDGAGGERKRDGAGDGKERRRNEAGTPANPG